MPRSQASLQLTNRYRDRLVASRSALQDRAQALWPTIETLDGTQWVERMASALTQAQIEAVRLNSAYLGAFLTSELGRRTDPPAIDASPYAGKSFDGRPLSESLRSPLIGVLGYLKDGLGASDSLSRGLERALRIVGVDYDFAHRTSLLSAIAEDDRFDGWNRSLAGTCGACAAVASGVSHELHFAVHPGCKCVASPIVKGVPNLLPVPTGQEIFDNKTTQEQDEMLGPEAANAVRSGLVSLEQLRGESELEEAPNFITQQPITAITN